MVHRQRYAMGTMFDVLIYHERRGQAQAAAGKALDEVERLDRVLSHFNPDSDLSRLERGGRRQFVSVDPDLFNVLRASVRISRLSQGRFDVTVAPLVQLWKNARREGRRPSAEAIRGVRRCVGFEKIEMAAPNLVRLRSDCLELDLGGIGKGYAVDRALAVLHSQGIRNALINAGTSSIAAIGAPPGRDGWPVSLGSAPATPVIDLRNNAISTSVQDDGTGEGIINPRSAAPARASGSVSVIAPSGALADALSTTLMLLSIEEAHQFLRELKSVSAYWVSPDGRVRARRPVRITGGR